MYNISAQTNIYCVGVHRSVLSKLAACATGHQIVKVSMLSGFNFTGLMGTVLHTLSLTSSSPVVIV